MSKTYSLKKYPASNTSFTIGVPVIVKGTLESRSGLVTNARGAKSNTFYVVDGDKSSDLTAFHSYESLGKGFGRYIIGHTVQVEITDSVTGVTITAPQKCQIEFTVTDELLATHLMQMALATLGLTFSTVTSTVPDATTLSELYQGSAELYGS